MLYYICEGGQIVKDANGRSSYEGREIIIILVYVNISFFKFVSFICAKASVESNSVKFHYTYKLDLS